MPLGRDAGEKEGLYEANGCLGWLVQFLVSVRHGDLKKMGYVASGFWSGFTIGRVVLADITHKLGERRMVFVYTALALIMQLMFWLIPNIPSNAVTICLLGKLAERMDIC